MSSTSTQTQGPAVFSLKESLVSTASIKPKC